MGTYRVGRSTCNTQHGPKFGTQTANWGGPAATCWTWYGEILPRGIVPRWPQNVGHLSHRLVLFIPSAGVDGSFGHGEVSALR